VIAARYTCEFIQRHTSVFGTVFIAYILQKGQLILVSIECLLLRIGINSHVPHSERSQLPDRINDMFRNEE